MIEWNGCWEDRSDRSICRWMVAWVRVGDVVAGCVGGYSGGGCFQLEKFVETARGFQIEASGNFSMACSQDLIRAAEDCQDLILEFHAEQAWVFAENLLLDDDRLSGLVREGELLYGGSVMPPEFKNLFGQVGLISFLSNERKKNGKKN